MAAKKKHERLLELAGEIHDLRRVLLAKEREFERLTIDAPAGADSESQPKAALAPLARASSLPNRVLAILDGASRPLTAPEIALLLQEPAAMDTVRTTLSKLHARGGLIERVSTGHYRSLHGGGHKRAANHDD